MNPAAISAAARGDLENFIAASTPGGIERQEAAGQRRFISSTTLPKNVRNASRAQMEALGFVFGEDVDELFVNCQLPAGWTKRATEHSMHTELLDDKGRVRAGIFYKAAFYDQRADMTFCIRFNVQTIYGGDDDKDARRCVIADCGSPIHQIGEWRRPDFDRGNALDDLGRAWLEENKPQWRDPFAYWD